MKRVLIYSDRGGIYGAEQINHALAVGLNGEALRVSVAQPAAANALTAAREQQGISHHWLPADDPYDLRQIAPSLIDPAAAECCFSATRPDFILFADSFPFASLAAKAAAAQKGIPYLALVHCVQPGWAEQYRELLLQLRAAYQEASEVVAVSTENLTLLRGTFGLPDACGIVIHNGRPDSFFLPSEDSERQRLRTALALSSDHILALTIGRCELVKGYDLLLAALPLLRRCPVANRLSFVWVGSGTLAGRVRKLAQLVGQGRVQLLSEQPDISPLLDAADLFVHPARYEGMPLVVLEAMAKGLPIIASAVSGIPEALGETGLLLPSPAATSDFPAQLAAAICALAADPGRRQTLGRAARARALDHFTAARMLGRYRELIHRSLEN